ncbi:MAG TPA: aspartate kinase [Flavobacteriaceae bacterium]|nr:aspartate kinase [Flavobacteriaceae bacterium]HIN98135.1 aspartate kinase [Flavobacteriaceae bacterium]
MDTAVTTANKIDLAALKYKTVNLVVFGHGNVGNAFLDQLFEKKESLLQRKSLEIHVVAIANSTRILFNEKGTTASWRSDKLTHGVPYSIDSILAFVETHQLENLIAVDNTADAAFTKQYEKLIANGFHIVSSNKHKNTAPWKEYSALRKLLNGHEKEYLYETNVGAGLPLIDTIKLLHQSGENITRIRGVFSGSLSYIFNEFSERNETFSAILNKAIVNGFTEPDPREDLCGMDVARKLLILARELDLEVELDDVEVQNLIPKAVRALDKTTFLKNLTHLDTSFFIKKKNLKKGNVLRYVADLHGDLSKVDGGKLTVSLQETPKSSMLGQLKGSDSIFEIYTESYGSSPIVIQGAGAGASVTARGVFGDVLRISHKL